MKTKKVMIGIKSVEAALDEFVKAGEAIEEGRPVRKESGVYFTGLEAFRKALTTKRLELLHIIKTKKPASIHELARMVHRDIKNVTDDIKYLAAIGLVETTEVERKVAATVNYDKILLEIAV